MLLARITLALTSFSLLLGAAAPSFDKARLDQMAEAARQSFSVPGLALAIVHNDQIVHLGAYGTRDLKTKAPLTPDSLFEIASTSKAFAAAAVALLADEKKLAFDDPVRKHLEYFRLSDPLANENVTIRDLLCHRTGLSRHDALWARTPFSREDIIRRAAFLPLSKQFRQEYQYQNIMFLTAGELAAKAAGAPSWDDFMKQRFFTPLEMKRTTTRHAEAIAEEDRAMPHRKRAAAIESYDWINYDNVGAAGAINSSARDLAQWVRLQLAGGEFNGRRLISKKNLEETWQPHMVQRLTAENRALNPGVTQITYALGWNIVHYQGRMILSHSGVLSGFRARVTLIPEQNLGFVLLANLDSTDAPEALNYALLDHLLDLPTKRDWKAHLLAERAKADAREAKQRAARESKRVANTKPSRELDRYAGAYEHPAYGRVQIAATATGLTIEWAGYRPTLEHYHYDTFTPKGANAPFANRQATFLLNAEGEPTRLQFLDVEFERLKTP